MKKIFIISILVLAVAGAVFADGYYPAYGSVPQARITDAQARSIAMKHAGVPEDKVINYYSHLKYDDGFLKYDVKFFYDQVEYEYDIDAVTGNILSMDRDMKIYSYGQQPAPPVAQSVSKPAATTQTTQTGVKQQITSQDALSIALTHANVSESQIMLPRVKQDMEHGRLVYEVKFHVGYMEYDYDIDAYTGQVLKFDCDYDD